MTPFEDRYKNKVSSLNVLFNEENYLRTIFEIELCWFWAISRERTDLVGFSNFYAEMIEQYDYAAIKQIEKDTNHDVVAVVSFMKNNLGLRKTHFGLTSQDVVSLAYSILSYKATSIIVSEVETMILNLKSFYSSVDVMMGYTHGQKATPIKTDNLINTIVKADVVGLDAIMARLQVKPITRFGNGACGDKYSLSKIMDINDHSYNVEKCLTLVGSITGIGGIATTYSRQTDYYPYVVSVCETFKLLSLVMKRESRNVWLLASHGLIKKGITKSEAGSSAMPHKVNPIEFENAEGNSQMCAALADVLMEKLLVSRLDRDLSDLTALRNVGSMFGYMLLSIKSMSVGYSRYELNKSRIGEILQNSYETLAETINLLMMEEGVEGAYDTVKALFMSKDGLNRAEFESMLNSCGEIPQSVIDKMLKLEI